MNHTQELDTSLVLGQYYNALDFIIEDLNEIKDESEYPISLNTITLI